MVIEEVRKGFIAACIPVELVDALLTSFEEAKRRFYRNDLRPNAVEGGRFSEAAFRILQWETNSGQYTPLGNTLPTVDRLLITLSNASGGDSVRLHIPRTLRLIYDMRNKRNVAHLADGIDPNLQDATLVVRNMEWVLAEFVRLYHNVTPSEAYRVIADLVSKDIPIIQEINGFPRILRDLKASEHCLALLYWRGASGATFAELATWVRPTMRANLRRTIGSLDGKNFVHVDQDSVYLTQLGEREVETAKLLEPV